MFRKIVGTILVGLLAPIMFKIGWLSAVIDAIFYSKYKYYDFQIDSLGVFLRHVYLETFVYEYLFAIIVIFLPFQLLKDYYLKNRMPLNFFRKILLLSCIVAISIIIVGTFSNIWDIPWYNNFKYILFSLLFGIIFTTILYLVIDRFDERKAH
ncbi:MAG: hypothetical protein K0R59_2952 [Sphingobacterium sp.]|jgi:hypothetical protein|nr:hypothetical protein [Sphingobacterium sp.]